MIDVPQITARHTWPGRKPKWPLIGQMDYTTVQRHYDERHRGNVREILLRPAADRMARHQPHATHHEADGARWQQRGLIPDPHADSAAGGAAVRAVTWGARQHQPLVCDGRASNVVILLLPTQTLSADLPDGCGPGTEVPTDPRQTNPLSAVPA